MLAETQGALLSEVFLIKIMIILVFTKTGGMISKRLGLPSVIGQVLTGIVLGPSLFGILHTDAFLDELGQLGVILLMFLAGLDTDMKQMKAVGARSLWVAMGGVFLPLVTGFGFIYLFRHDFQQALFVGTMLTATSVSISAQTLIELGKLKTKEGNVILGAAVIDDIIGIVLLALVVGIGSELSLWSLLGNIVLFFVITFVFGGYVVPYLVAKHRKFDIREGRVTLALGCCLLFAWLAEFMGVAAIIGAYMIGIFFGQTRIRKLVVERVEILAYTFFVPIFFITIGASADLKQLASISFFFLFGLLMVAIFSKMLGCALVDKLFKNSWRSSFAIGSGMISRGEVMLIMASLGLREGLIGQDIFSGAILIVLVTTLVTPVLLSFLFKDKLDVVIPQPIN